MAMTNLASTPLSTDDLDAGSGGRAIVLGLGGLSAGIAAMGSLSVTVDGVPDAARLSAGQFLGDGSWSVRPADLDGLALHPSPGHNKSCRLSIRLRKIDKDMGDAFSIGAVYVDVDADAGRAVIAGTDGAISLRRKRPEGEAGPARSADPKPVAKAAWPTETPKAESAPEPQAAAPTAAPAVEPRRARVRVKPRVAWPGTAAPSPAIPAPPAPPEPIDLGVAPPSVLGDAMPASVAAASVDDAHIVQVRVTPGMRIGKFGKTGRPEEVVSVRGRDARSDRSRTIVFIGPAAKRSPQA